MEIIGDHLTIYDGSNEQATQIAKMSGNLGIFDISSNDNSLLVNFLSDHTGTYGGFLAVIHYGNPYLNIKLLLKIVMFEQQKYEFRTELNIDKCNRTPNEFRALIWYQFLIFLACNLPKKVQNILYKFI